MSWLSWNMDSVDWILVAWLPLLILLILVSHMVTDSDFTIPGVSKFITRLVTVIQLPLFVFFLWRSHVEHRCDAVGQVLHQPCVVMRTGEMVTVSVWKNEGSTTISIQGYKDEKPNSFSPKFIKM